MERVFKTEITCSECGANVHAERAAYETEVKRYCTKCAPIQQIKQSWQPMHSGYSVSAIYIVPNKSILNIAGKSADSKDTDKI